MAKAHSDTVPEAANSLLNDFEDMIRQLHKIQLPLSQGVNNPNLLLCSTAKAEAFQSELQSFALEMSSKLAHLRRAVERVANPVALEVYTQRAKQLTAENVALRAQVINLESQLSSGAKSEAEFYYKFQSLANVATVGVSSGGGKRAPTEDEAIAHHVIDRTFDDYKMMIQKQLKECQQKLEEYESGEVTRRHQRKVAELEVALARKEQELDEGKRRIVDLMLEVQRARASSNGPSSSCGIPFGGGASSSGVEELIALVGQSVLGGMLHHLALHSAIVEQWGEAHLSLVENIIFDVGATLRAQREEDARHKASNTERKPSSVKALAAAVKKTNTKQVPQPPSEDPVAYGDGGSGARKLPLLPRTISPRSERRHNSHAGVERKIVAHVSM